MYRHIVSIIMTLCLSGGSESTRNRVHLDSRRVAVLLTRQRESGPEEKLETAVWRNGGRQISQAGHNRGDEGRVIIHTAHLLTCMLFDSVEMSPDKGQVHFQNKPFLIVYSSKMFLSFFSRKDITFHSRIFLHIGDFNDGQRLERPVSVQLQRARRYLFI